MQTYLIGIKNLCNMSKNMFILTVCAISFICSCTDTICGDETMKSEPIESHYVVLDSLAIYKIQTDKSMMLNNLIRYQSGKLDDAKKIGISEMMYNQVLEHVEQLNNSNLKLK